MFATAPPAVTDAVGSLIVAMVRSGLLALLRVVTGYSNAGRLQPGHFLKALRIPSSFYRDL